MKSRYLKFSLLLLFIILILFLLNYDVLFKNEMSFERLNAISLPDRLYAYFFKRERYDRYIQLEKEYQKSLEILRKNEKTGSIKKIIHQVWFGAKLPSIYKFYREKCMDMHPGWEFKLWSMDEILKENFPSVPMLSNTLSYAEMSDIMRYEIVKKYGGIYLDSDVDCLNKLDSIADNFDYWFNTEAQISAVFSNAIFASKINSHILKNALLKVKENYYDKKAIAENTQYINKKLAHKEPVDRNHMVAVLTTMLPLGDSVNKELGVTKKMLVLPAAYCDKPYFFKANMPSIINRIKGFLFFKQYIEFVLPQPYCAQFKRENFNSYLSSPEFNFALTAKKAVSAKSWMISFYAPNQDQIQAFKLLYDKNFPGAKSFSDEALIPKNIYLMTSGDDKISIWQNMLQGITINKIDREQVTTILNKNDYLLSSDLGFNNFVAGLLLIKQNGGVMINNDNFSPHLNYLREILYKYRLFFVTEPSERRKELLLSHKILGADKNHNIIDFLLRKIKENNLRTVDEIEKLLAETVYQKISFIAKDSIVFPAAQFFGKEKNNTSFTYEDN